MGLFLTININHIVVYESAMLGYFYAKNNRTERRQTLEHKSDDDGLTINVPIILRNLKLCIKTTVPNNFSTVQILK